MVLKGLLFESVSSYVVGNRSLVSRKGFDGKTCPWKQTSLGLAASALPVRYSPPNIPTPQIAHRHTTNSMSLKRERPLSTESGVPPKYFRSSRIIEGTSSFEAAFSTEVSAKALQTLPEFASATHRIAAWRRRSRQKSLMPDTKILYDLGYDDDGEKYAGSRLQSVLNDSQVQGEIVVARWYGGQNIGPIRFTHIENAAKQAIWSWKAAAESEEKEQTAKKRKLEEEKSRKDLETNLRERDLNIFVLRTLLADKKARLNKSEPAPPTPQKPPPDYATLSAEALGRIDKARDATIAFILKQIDNVEEQLKILEALEDEPTQNSARDEVIGPEPTENAPHTPKKDRGS
ncbi:unnamed protein product [Periconia digitata]|uniref:Impact N-terminal domain-containing protein n=1 Tax=Periconia digitata TaxID=1303443 RepID=A0A9W4URG7_9PLEO|nr:unnamed protein product [Periconia digitata]